METVTRFAPSPNGSLHLGHAYSAIVSHDLAAAKNGIFLLRIEDIDGARSRPELVDEFRRDLEWLGLEWFEVPAQSSRLESYVEAANTLIEMGVLYKCTCTRSEIQAAGSRIGPEGPVYPGTCRQRTINPERAFALRIDIHKAMQRVGELAWTDSMAGTVIADPREFGDVVIVRKDEPASYHLAATLDDAADGVTLVTRGQDLYRSTHLHRVLQELLRLPVPVWHHHGLLLDADGRKLAKRRNSPSLADLRNSGEDGLLLAEQLRLRQLPSGISYGSA
ncbi:MAG: tRNA glutamyl-Q(34) synthetase GluQRS [Pseudomonadota bacterium]